MLSNILKNTDIIDCKINIDFKTEEVTINRVTYLQIKYVSCGVFIKIIGDESPDENGRVKQRTFICEEIENSKNNSYFYSCDYTETFINSKELESVTVIKRSDNHTFFSRLC